MAEPAAMTKPHRTAAGTTATIQAAATPPAKAPANIMAVSVQATAHLATKTTTVMALTAEASRFFIALAARTSSCPVRGAAIGRVLDLLQAGWTGNTGRKTPVPFDLS